jgi:ATP-dependent Clp protease ATP-binding subunit ClpA
MAEYLSKWHRELDIFCGIKNLLLLEGNVLDSYRYPVEGSMPKGSIVRLPEYLHYYFKDRGYQEILFYDSLQGFTNPFEADDLTRFGERFSLAVDGQACRSRFKAQNGLMAQERTAPELIRELLAQTEEASVVILDFASRYIAAPERLQQNEVDSFTILLQAALNASEVHTANGMLKNLLILIVNKANDLPAWFYLQNPNVKIITLETPSRAEREDLLQGQNFRTFFAREKYLQDEPYYEEHPDELKKIQERFVALTEGFTFTELIGLKTLCKTGGYAIRDMSNVVDLYKYGVKENPWKNLNAATIKTAQKAFQSRVKGQDYAITKTLDVIKRSMIGMSGLQGSSHTRPRGVLFFAGPTGTGKTETAKTLAEILFGDERSCIRFDMSEYGQSHSDQKLLGAPPGYVGYEAGGQLTNAVKKNPFSILLFDEIEKAHPSILDKFLQILEDGRMTDGQGNTVYFSESIIIFTSNLGIYTRDERGERKATVSSEMPYTEISKKIRSAIEDYFKLEIGRPEILNRIGENIVVFDFIRPEVAKEILSAQVDRIVASLAADKHIDLRITDQACEALYKKCLSNLDNGGRGIGNVIEDALLNPLSRYLFDNGVFENASVTIEKINMEELPVSVECTI